MMRPVRDVNSLSLLKLQLTETLAFQITSPPQKKKKILPVASIFEFNFPNVFVCLEYHSFIYPFIQW